jgi:hypothetical protein
MRKTSTTTVIPTTNAPPDIADKPTGKLRTAMKNVRLNAQEVQDLYTPRPTSKSTSTSPPHKHTSH